MSYVLHIWEQPSAKNPPVSVGEADQFLQIARKLQLGQNAKFLDFAERLTAKYPCICSNAAEDLPKSEWAWSDGPLDGRTNSGVYSIGLNVSMLEEVRPLVINEAKALGLSLMDEQAGEVYLANGTLLSVRPTVAPMNSSRKNYDDVPKERELQKILFERLVPFMERHGYKARKSSQSFKCTFPGGWHEINLVTTDRWPLEINFCFGVGSRFHVVTDLVESMKTPQRPPEEIKLQKTTGLPQRVWMKADNSFLGGPNRDYVINSYSQIDDVLKDVFQKMETHLLPVLEKYKTIHGLDQLLNPDPVTDSIFFHGYDFGAHHIVTAYLASNPRLEQLCEEYLLQIEKRKGFSSLIEWTRRSIEYVRSQPRK